MKTTYLVLSNNGELASIFGSKEAAVDECIRLNSEELMTSVVYQPVKLGPYRLLFNIDDLKHFTIVNLIWENLGDNVGAWYMTKKEYSSQLLNANTPWQIRDENAPLAVNIKCQFDTDWYELYLTVLKALCSINN